MADGMICIHCGHQETPHKYPEVIEDEEDFATLKPGKNVSLKDCPGFEPEDRREAERLRLKREKEDADAASRRGMLGPDDYED